MPAAPDAAAPALAFGTPGTPGAVLPAPILGMPETPDSVPPVPVPGASKKPGAVPPAPTPGKPEAPHLTPSASRFRQKPPYGAVLVGALFPAAPGQAVPPRQQSRFARAAHLRARAAQDLQTARRFALFLRAALRRAPFPCRNRKSRVFPRCGAQYAAGPHWADIPGAPAWDGAAIPALDKRAFEAAFYVPRLSLPFLYFQIPAAFYAGSASWVIFAPSCANSAAISS